MADFKGIGQSTFDFLAGLMASNDKGWFEAHRAQYEADYVGAGMALVAALGPRLRAISPDVRLEPKINRSIMRINRDVRFSKDKRPYKDHLDLWFWHGETKGWDCPGFFLRLTATEIMLGVGILGFSKPDLERYRQAVSNPKKAADLAARLAAIETSGVYEIGGKTRKTAPRGYAADGPGADLLLYEGLTASLTWDASVARAPDFIEFLVGHYTKLWPVGAWILAEVVD